MLFVLSRPQPGHLQRGSSWWRWSVCTYVILWPSIRDTSRVLYSPGVLCHCRISFSYAVWYRTGNTHGWSFAKMVMRANAYTRNSWNSLCEYSFTTCRDVERRRKGDGAKLYVVHSQVLSGCCTLATFPANVALVFRFYCDGATGEFTQPDGKLFLSYALGFAQGLRSGRLVPVNFWIPHTLWKTCGPSFPSTPLTVNQINCVMRFRRILALVQYEQWNFDV